MSKATKIWLVIAASLILLGALIIVGVMTTVKWNFNKLSTVTYETEEHAIHEVYQSITVVTDTADVVLLPAEGDATTVLCRESENTKHTVTVKDGTLVIELVDTRKWYEYIQIGNNRDKIEVYLPRRAYGALAVSAKTGCVDIPKDFSFEEMKISVTTGAVSCEASIGKDATIRTTTGHITLGKMSAGSLSLTVRTGKVKLSDVACEGAVLIAVSTGEVYVTDLRCQSLNSTGSTGDLSLKNVIADEKFDLERGTGDVTLEACDASEIVIRTDTGDVEGSLLSEKIFLTKTDTGHVLVPHSTMGGRCEITTDTGDIEISVRA